ncbi:MAG: hypothetical protein ACR2LJ_10335 [Acidimicrobiales bacterium]
MPGPLGALLVVDEMCVGDLAVALDATEDAVSYALRLLRITPAWSAVGGTAAWPTTASATAMSAEAWPRRWPPLAAWPSCTPEAGADGRGG